MLTSDIFAAFVTWGEWCWSACRNYQGLVQILSFLCISVLSIDLSNFYIK